MEKKLTIKEQIKVLAQEQKVLRNQRKTDKLVGERTMDPWQAAMKHKSNRFQLRYLYAAYGIIRGKSLEQIEGKSKEPINMDKVNKLIEQYNEQAIHPNP